MRIIKYLKHCKGAVALIMCLLLVQACADLALPKLTSQIVDVGIQQAGVEHAATQEMTANTFHQVIDALPESDAAFVRSCYDETAQGMYRLNSMGYKEREALDMVIAAPLVEVYGLHSPDSQLVGQQALIAARAEYNALGYDTETLQMNYLMRTGGLMLAVAALGMVVSIAVSFIASKTGAQLGYQLRSRLFDQVVHFSDAQIGRFSVASLITRGTNDIQLVQNIVVMMLRIVLYAPILALGGIVMVMQTNASMGWIIVVAVVVLFVVMGILMMMVMPKFRVMQKLIDRVNLVAREMLTGLSVVRAFGRQNHEGQRFDEASTQLLRTQLFTNRAMACMSPVMMLVMNGMSVAIVWVGSHYVDMGSIQTGDLIAFITYSIVIVSSFLMIGMISIMLPRADVAAQRIDEVLAVVPDFQEIQQDARQDEQQGGGVSWRVRQDAKQDGGIDCCAQQNSSKGAEIRFEKVSFAYEDSHECVLKDVSFTAAAGKTTAIVGGTGSGKSTIIKLIERFHDVSAGAVLVDGIDIKSLSLHELRQQFGYVPQQAFLFSGTIASNIAYGNEAMEHEYIQHAAECAQAADFIAEKDEMYESPIAQGGTNVSGGQRQRIAIARALATNARAFLFDDSFSALDYKTDAALRHALTTQLAGHTVLVVAQRIATVMHADHIVVLDEGCVVGQGTHKQLMRTCATYREIAFSQLSERELLGDDAQ